MDPGVELRAGMHAALGEASRLRIVDHLLLGDASPGELGLLVDLPTNLLAHHLNVLSQAGLIRRVRSEGDRRRSYVQLVNDDPAVAAITGAMPAAMPVPPARVVFVCTHNSARSQLAAAAWKKASTVPATSAGTHPGARVHPRAISVGRRHGLRLGHARTAQVRDVLSEGDLVVAVCDRAHEEIAASSPAERRYLHWSVPDPARPDTDDAFESAYTGITARVVRLAGTLTKPHPPNDGDTP